ncbi:MAG: ABC transporter permease [Patescibacteria group bacterium]|nr:ABC transporter permease [Patescibacteria group bacterium]
MRNIFIIWRKELKDALRDKRTLMAMIVMPMVLMPLIIIGMFKLIDYQMQQAEKQVVKVAVENKKNDSDLVEFISSQENLEIVNISLDLEAAVKEKAVDLAIIVPEDIEDRIKKQEVIKIEVIEHSLNDRSDIALGKVNQAVTAYNKQVLESRFKDQGISGNILSGVVIEKRDVATKEEIGGFGLGFLLPLLIVMWANVGGQYIAIDVSAGEKERKTLESLLLTPVKRLEIVFGKFLAVSTSALTSVVISLVSIYIAINQFGFKIEENIDKSVQNTASGAGGFAMDFSIEPAALLVIFAVSILLVLVFSAILLSISIFAKSYKEAQNYLGPSYMIIILPVVIVNSIPNFKPPLALFAVPAVNTILLFKEILVGAYDWGHIAITVGSLAISALLAIWTATKIYSNEKVLFRV